GRTGKERCLSFALLPTGELESRSRRAVGWFFVTPVAKRVSCRGRHSVGCCRFGCRDQMGQGIAPGPTPAKRPDFAGKFVGAAGSKRCRRLCAITTVRPDAREFVEYGRRTVGVQGSTCGCGVGAGASGK